MRRDLDLVRDIMIHLDERDSCSIMRHEDLASAIGQEDVRLVAYQCRLMAQAGFIACETIKRSTSDRVINAIPFELTWEGHEFLRLSRDKAWNEAKRRLGDGFAGVSFDILKALLLQYAKDQLGIGPGG
jgi:hypothetical protein